jgi:hypothetical protein
MKRWRAERPRPSHSERDALVADGLVEQHQVTCANGCPAAAIPASRDVLGSNQVGEPLAQAEAATLSLLERDRFRILFPALTR